MRRIFLAVHPDAESVEKIRVFAQRLADDFSSAGIHPSWVQQSLFHLTLHFFGDMSDEAIESLRAEFRRAPLPARPPEFTATSLAYLPSARIPRALCLDFSVRPRGAMDGIVVTARTCATQLGAETEKRPWRAHLTVARLKSPAALSPDSLPAPPGITFSPHSCELVESFLSPSGPRYSLVDSFPFG